MEYSLRGFLEKRLPTGQHTIKWNAGEFSSGVYFAVFKSKYFNETNKMVC